MRLAPGTTKNGEGRFIFLTEDLQAILRDLRAQRDVLFPDCPYVFHCSGRPLRNCYAAWRSACTKAGLEGRIPHDLRRSAVRNMVRAGIPEKTAQEIAGHKTRSVFDRYDIVDEGDRRQAAKRRQEAFGRRTATVSATGAVSHAEGKPVKH